MKYKSLLFYAIGIILVFAVAAIGCVADRPALLLISGMFFGVICSNALDDFYQSRHIKKLRSAGHMCSDNFVSGRKGWSIK